MTGKYSVLGLFLIPFCVLAEGSAPDGWGFYENTTEKSAYKAGKAFYLRSNSSNLLLSDDPKSKPSDSGQIFQGFSASDYIGKRVRISMMMRFDSVGKGYGGLYVNVRDSDKGLVMGGWDSISAKDQRKWVRKEVIFDVPEKSSSINFGAQIFGVGELLLADVKVEAVEKSVKMKNLFEEFSAKQLGNRPVNLP